MSAPETRQEALREQALDLAADLAYWPDERIDVDTFTDSLSADCMGAEPVEALPQIREVTAADFTGIAAPRVLAIALDEGQPMLTRIAALDSLRERYLGA